MEVPGRSEETAHPDAAERELHERVGYARCQMDQARERLAEILRQKQEMEHELEVAQKEVLELRQELDDKLGEWCALDDLSQRHELVSGFITKLESVRTSLTYRITRGLLLIINKIGGFVTLGWLRDKKANKGSES